MKSNYNLNNFIEKETLVNILNNLVDRFVNLRKSKKISQKKLADLSGVSYASIRRFESKGEISFASLLKLAKALNQESDFNKLFISNTITDLKDF